MVVQVLAEIGNLLFGDGEKLPTILVGAGRLGSAVSSFISRDANGYKLLGAASALSDLGASIACTPGEGRMTVEAKGATDLQLVFPADAASGLIEELNRRLGYTHKDAAE